MKPRIIIVGGGACGLMAARILSPSYQVILLEHRDQLGGRIRTIRSGDQIIEAGAEFIHGNLPLTIGLLKEAGLHYVKAEGRMLRKEGNKWTEQTDTADGWEEFFTALKKESEDMTLNHFLAKHFSDDRHEAFRAEVRQFAMGFDLADPEDVSVMSLYNEWSNEETKYRIKEGYGPLVDFLEKECRTNGAELVLGETVKQVDWQTNEVTVTCGSGKTYRADKILVTIPVSILADVNGPCSIKFSLPVEEYIKCSKLIGFGTVIKVVIEFEVPLWEPGTAFIFSEEQVPTWWTPFPLRGNHLTGWVGGPMGDRISDQSDEELLQLAHKSLAHIFERTLDELKQLITGSHVFNWKNYPETFGAYSYSTISSRNAREMLNTPIDGTLFFAGEGLYQGKDSGTVEAALFSAKQVSQIILSS